MSEMIQTPSAPREPAWVTSLARSRPDAVLMAPYMAYLLLMLLDDLFPPQYLAWSTAIRCLGSLYVFWLFRRHYPPLGRPRVGIALVAGVAVAFGWYYGQLFFNEVNVAGHSLGGRMIGFPGTPGSVDPRDGLSPWAWWSQVVTRLVVVTTAVPMVEELFWRAFVLRAFINLDRVETVPLGKFTWFSFLGSSLLSTLQHPDNWAVSILCWMVYNGLFYWTRSLRCLMLTHAVTNLVLYVWVLMHLDSGGPAVWRFW